MSDSDSESYFESADDDSDRETSDKSSDGIRVDHAICKEFESRCNANKPVDYSDRTEKDSTQTNITRPQQVVGDHSIDHPTAGEFPKDASDEISPQVDSHEKAPQESKRVTLRLEKKIQQKNKQLPKANSTDTDQSTSNLVGGKPIGECEKSSSWGFGSWGASFLSTAACSVSTFTNQVSQGIGSVFESVESSLGAPAPEELADTLNKRQGSNDTSTAENKDMQREDEKVNSDHEDDKNEKSGTSLLQGVTSWTRVFENTGTKVIKGGLDTLEMIGKKTIDILTEGDPGLRNKRAAFSDGITLSQLLREAKTKTDERKEVESEDNEDAINYSIFFDEFQGLVHLEALEMLSGQCQAKVQSLLMKGYFNGEKKDILDKIRSVCEDIPVDDTPDEHKTQFFEALFLQEVQALSFPLGIEKIMQTQKSINDWLTQCMQDQTSNNFRIEKEIYHMAIKRLAEFTARCVEQFHKIAELILVQPSLEPSVLHCAMHLTKY